jgi:hypothetical protein
MTYRYFAVLLEKSGVGIQRRAGERIICYRVRKSKMFPECRHQASCEVNGKHQLGEAQLFFLFYL